jgi:hypothetical protein
MAVFGKHIMSSIMTIKKNLTNIIIKEAMWRPPSE